MRRFACLLALVLAACSQPEQTPKPSPRAPTWVDVAVPIERLDSGASNADLDPLRSSFASARVIAIGEATHGSHEFFALRERLLVWSIAELGVRALAIEASMAEITELDRYICGEAELEQARALLERSSTWPLRTMEFAHTLGWLRVYNRDRSADERVHIYGFDIQQPWVTLEHLQRELGGRADVERLLTGEALQLLAVPPAKYLEYDEDQRARIRAALLELDTQLRSAALDDPLLLRIAGTLTRVESHYRASHAGVSPPREQAMADNVRWLAETMSPSAPMLVWAHNGHVSRKPIHASHTDAMGRHLAEQLGNGFVNVGFVFAQGDFLARDRDMPNRTIHAFSLPHGPPEGLGPRLASGGMPMFALDLRTSPADSLRTWLSEPRKGWMVGSVVSDPQKQVGELELLSSFDVIVFVERVTAASLIP